MNNDSSMPGIYVLSLCLGLTVITGTHAGSTIYKHIDKNGNITFTNRPIKGGNKFKNAQPSPPLREVTVNVAKHSPKENVYKQDKHEIKRREILEYELTTEKKLLFKTKKYLSSLRNNGKLKPQKKIKQLRNKMQRHKRNITALKQELAKL